MSLGSFVSGALGGDNDFHQNAYTNNAGAYNYGGTPNGAADRQGQLSQLGQQANATGQAGNNYSATQPYQSGQNDALGMIRQQALGNDGGVAEMQMKQGAAQAAQSQMAAAASSRGGGAAIAAGQNAAMNNAAGLAAGANFQAGQLRAQNQQAGIQNYLQGNQSALAQQAQMAQANGQLGLGYAGIQQGYEGMNNQIGQAQMNGQMSLDQQQAANYNAASAVNANVASGNASAAGSVGGAVLGAGASAASSALSSSDANQKMQIQPQTDAQGRKPGGGDMFNPATYAQSGGNALGEAQLAERDAHTANFAQMGGGMGNWFNVSNAAPWSPEGDAAKSNLAHYMGMQSGNAGAGAGMGNSPHFTLSDTRAKKDAIFQAGAQAGQAAARMPQDTGNAADGFMASAAPYTYKYKNPGENGGETRLGPMAQGLEQGPTGRDIVKDTPRGKMVDTAALSLANAGAAGRLHERLSKLEQMQADPLNRDIAAQVNSTPEGSLKQKYAEAAATQGFSPRERAASERDAGAAWQASQLSPGVQKATSAAKRFGFSPEETMLAADEAQSRDAAAAQKDWDALPMGERMNRKLAQWSH